MADAQDNIVNDVIDDDIEYAFSTNTKTMAKMVQQGIKNCGAYNTDYNAIDVLPQDPEYIGFNLYLCSQLAQTTLASNSTLNANTIVVTSATNITTGKAINIVQGARIFQSLVTNVSGTTITIASPLDYAYTAGATVCVGDWNLNKNGSVTPVTFAVQPPPNAKFHITAISITMTDDASMDDSKFGSLTALTNGLIARRIDGSTANYFLITNNSGFYQAGYNTDYPTKVPSGVYAFRARKDLLATNGNVIALDGTTNDQLQFIVRDNLTTLSEITVSVHGHIVED